MESSFRRSSKLIRCIDKSLYRHEWNFRAKKKKKGEKKVKNFFIKNFHSENRGDHAFFFFVSSLSLFVVQTEGFKVSIAFGNSADIMNRPRWPIFSWKCILRICISKKFVICQSTRRYRKKYRKMNKSKKIVDWLTGSYCVRSSNFS